MIINIRGTSGSGKTYAVRDMMSCIGSFVDVVEDRVVAQCGFYDMEPVYVIGNYGANVCGGCDTIPTQNMVCSLVRHFSQVGHVVFEGLLLSHLYARYVALDDELSDYGDRYVWAFLDTPLDVCIERILDRRRDRGDFREFNTENTESKYYSILRCREKVMVDGREVVDLVHDSKDGMADQLLTLLMSDDLYSFSNSYREESFRKRRQ